MFRTSSPRKTSFESYLLKGPRISQSGEVNMGKSQPLWLEVNGQEACSSNAVCIVLIASSQVLFNVCAISGLTSREQTTSVI